MAFTGIDEQTAELFGLGEAGLAKAIGSITQERSRFKVVIDSTKVTYKDQGEYEIVVVLNDEL